MRRTNLVIEDLVILVLGRELLAFFRRGITAVIEPIALPGNAGDFHPFQMIGLPLLGVNIHHVNVGPVRTTLGDAVAQHVSVFRKRELSQARCAIGGKFIRVEQNFRRAVEAFLPVPDVLVLQTIVLRIEEVVAAARGRRVFRIVVKLQQAILDLLAKGNFFQISEGDLVFRLNP